MSQKSSDNFYDQHSVSSSPKQISVEDILGFTPSKDSTNFSKKKTPLKLANPLEKKEGEQSSKKMMKTEFDIDTEKNKINPYNFNNRLITRADVETILKRYGIYRTVNDISLYQQACVHETYSKAYVNNIMSRYDLELVNKPKGAIELQDESYESFEFVGDAIIGNVIAFYLYKRLSNESEGTLSRIKSNMENRDALARLTKTIGLNKFMLISRYVEDKNNGRNKVKPLADMFESFIFALYLDFNKRFTYSLSDMYSGPGFQIVEKFLTNLFDDEETGFDLTDLILKDTNYIDKLNKYFQKFYRSKINMKRIAYLAFEKQKIQVYGIIDADNKLIGVGKHQESRHAKQIAARQALFHLGILNELDYDDEGFNPSTVDAYIHDSQENIDKHNSESDKVSSDSDLDLDLN